MTCSVILKHKNRSIMCSVMRVRAAFKTLSCLFEISFSRFLRDFELSYARHSYTCNSCICNPQVLFACVFS